jgi:hypothetical protein
MTAMADDVPSASDLRKTGEPRKRRRGAARPASPTGRDRPTRVHAWPSGAPGQRGGDKRTYHGIAQHVRRKTVRHRAPYASTVNRAFPEDDTSDTRYDTPQGHASFQPAPSRKHSFQVSFFRCRIPLHVSSPMFLSTELSWLSSDSTP